MNGAVLVLNVARGFETEAMTSRLALVPDLPCHSCSSAQGPDCFCMGRYKPSEPKLFFVGSSHNALYGTHKEAAAKRVLGRSVSGSRLRCNFLFVNCPQILRKLRSQ